MEIELTWGTEAGHVVKYIHDVINYVVTRRP